jgi:apolipoprotein N-acyltransferase
MLSINRRNDTVLSVNRVVGKLVKQLSLILLFSVIISVAFLDMQRFYLAWLAFVPLFFAIEGATLSRTYCLGTLAGLAAFASGKYWIVDFITLAKGSDSGTNYWLAFLYWLYCSQMLALLLTAFNWLRKNTNIHDFILFPVLLASFTVAYPMLFTMRLADSQVNFYSAIQATELLGSYALDALIALVNIMGYYLLVKLRSYFVSRSIDRNNRFKEGSQMQARSLLNQPTAQIDSASSSKLPWLFGCSLISLWFIYGFSAYWQWEKKVNSWSTMDIGIVQPNEIPQLTKKKPYPGYSNSHPPEMEMTERLASLDVKLVIWPEANPKLYRDNLQIRNAYQKTVKDLGTALLFQDISRLDISDEGRQQHHNSAIMLNSEGRQVGLYHKIKRIPFGEYIPLLADGSRLNSWVEDVLGNFLNHYVAGEQHQRFTHPQANIIPLICYETTFSEFVANAVHKTANDRQEKNKEDANGLILVGLSNDGWFGSTHQPYQHIMGSVLRAVENRLPLVHVANNGPSIVVSPSGKVLFSTDFQQAGGYVTKVPYSNTAQGSFYSHYPWLFKGILYLCSLVFFVYGVIGYRRKR